MPERGVLAVWTVLVYMVQFTLVLDRYQSVTSALQLMAGRTCSCNALLMRRDSSWRRVASLSR